MTFWAGLQLPPSGAEVVSTVPYLLYQAPRTVGGFPKNPNRNVLRALRRSHLRATLGRELHQNEKEIKKRPPPLHTRVCSCFPLGEGSVSSISPLYSHSLALPLLPSKGGRERGREEGSPHFSLFFFFPPFLVVLGAFFPIWGESGDVGQACAEAAFDGSRAKLVYMIAAFGGDRNNNKRSVHRGKARRKPRCRYAKRRTTFSRTSRTVIRDRYRGRPAELPKFRIGRQPPRRTKNCAHGRSGPTPSRERG